MTGWPMAETLNIPNLFSSFRLVLSPFLAVIFFIDGTLMRFIVLGVVLVCELTDFMDGYLARKYGQETEMGSVFDSLADTIYRDTIFLCLAIDKQVTLFLVLPILYRDSIVSTLLTVCVFKGLTVNVQKSRKRKAIFQSTVIIAILVVRIISQYVPILDFSFYLLANILMSVACIATLYTIYEYFVMILPIVLQDDANKAQNR